MAGLMDKFMHFIGLEDEEETQGGKSEALGTEASQPEPPPRRRDLGPVPSPAGGDDRRRKAPVVSLHGNQPGNMKVMVLEPLTFEEVTEIANHLKLHRPVVLNLEDTSKEVAQRILDFLLGSAYSLDGGMQRISAGVFLFTPPNVEIAPADKENYASGLGMGSDGFSCLR